MDKEKHLSQFLLNWSLWPKSVKNLFIPRELKLYFVSQISYNLFCSVFQDADSWHVSQPVLGWLNVCYDMDKFDLPLKFSYHALT